MKNALTVRELIAKLQAMDPDAEVWAHTRTDQLACVTDVTLDTEGMYRHGEVVYLEKRYR